MKLKIKNLLIGICISLTLLLNYEKIYIKEVSYFFDGKIFIPLILLIIIVTIIIYLILSKLKITDSLYLKIISLLFMIFVLIGNSYLLYGSIDGLYLPYMLLFTIIKAFGLYFILKYILGIIINFVSKWTLKLDLKKDNKITKLFNKHPFWFCFLVLATCWSIYFIAFYPIVLSPDPSYQIKQSFNERTKYSDYSIQLDENVNITNHHPVIHTVMLGSFIRLGRILLNDNFGLFLYSLVQGIFMIVTLSSTITFLKKHNIGNKYLFLMLLIYALVPMFPLYAINGNKDVYYSLFIIWLIMLLFDYIENYKNVKIDNLKLFGWFIILMLICLFRNNGIYIVIPLFISLIFYSKVNFKKIFITFISVIILYFSYTNALLPALKITGGSIRETMSIFFQQTARYVINHEEELSSEDKKVINTIIDYDNIKTSYDPEISDPIKNTFNKYATSSDLKNYFTLWLKGLITHPLTYIDATLNNVYGYFDPEKTNWYVYYKYDDRITQNDLVDYHYNNLSGLRNVLSSYAVSFPYIPILGLISNIGISSWIMLAMGIYLIIKKQYRYLYCLIPLYLSLLICILSPVNAYFRYAMPYVFSNLLIIGIWIYIHKLNQK